MIHYSFYLIHSKKTGLTLPSVDCKNKKFMKGGDDKFLVTCQETVPQVVNHFQCFSNETLQSITSKCIQGGNIGF